METTKEDLQQVQRRLEILSQQLADISQEVSQINNQVNNFIILIDRGSTNFHLNSNQSNLECPEDYENCPNNPEYCVFKYATEDDKRDVCESEEMRNLTNTQAIISPEPYDYSYNSGRFNVKPLEPKRVALGVRRSFTGGSSRLREQV